MLFEDSLMVRDSTALAELFEVGAVLVTDETQPARGSVAIARLALETWDGDHTYVADPLLVRQARDIALIVAQRTINVARCGHDGVWRYAIVLCAVDKDAESGKR